MCLLFVAVVVTVIFVEFLAVVAAVAVVVVVVMAFVCVLAGHGVFLRLSTGGLFLVLLAFASFGACMSRKKLIIT